MADGIIHIALAFDDNFWAPAFAVMRSVCLTTPQPDRIRFHLCHENLTDAQRRELDSIATEFGAGIAHYPLDQHSGFGQLAERLPLARRFRRIIYARLLLDRILPAELSRVIYLDSDTMAVADIAQVWQADLASSTLGAVNDPMRLLNMHGRDLAEKRDIFQPAMPYFNSGMLVIDLARYRAADIPAQLQRLADTGVLGRLYYDQDMLNLIFAGDWQALDWRFNIVDPHMAHQAMNPVIVHYTLQARPWTLRAGLMRTIAFARLYRHVMTNRIFYAFLRQRLVRAWLPWLARRR